VQAKPKKREEPSDEQLTPLEPPSSSNDDHILFESPLGRPPGTVIDGRYEIHSLIGVGGMSSVYRVHHAALDRTVALKMLHPHLLTERTSLERFLQEARAESSLKHSNIVSVHSMGTTEDGALYLVMDFVEGVSLTQLVFDRGSVSAKEAVPIFLEICQGLKAAHANSILHRDLKPSNIMLSVTADGSKRSVKIVDFGIAKLMKPDSSQRLTKAGSILGSPSYMSPEQCQGKPQDFRSDIYSLGCLMYECLTGQLPFDANSELEILYKHVREVPRSFLQVAPDAAICPDIQDAIFKCLEKDPDHRYQTVDELLADLTNADLEEKVAVGGYLRKQNAAATDVSEPGTRSKKRPTNQILLVIGAAASICMLLLGWKPGFALYETRLHQPTLKKQAVAASKSYGSDSRQSGLAWLEYADALWSVGDLTGARAAYKAAVPAFAKDLPPLDTTKKLMVLDRVWAQEPAQQVGCLNKLVREFSAQKRVADAKACAERSVQLAKTCDAWTKIVAASDLSMLLAQKGDFANAESTLRVPLGEDVSKVPYKDELARAFTSAGDYALNGKAFDRAIGYYNKSLALLIDGSAQQKRIRSIDYRRIGDCYLAQSDLLRARTFYQKAVDSHLGPSSLLPLREDVRVLADVMYSLDDLEGAQQNYRRALKLSEPLGIDGTFVSIQKGLADCHFRKGEFAAAYPIYSAINGWLYRNPKYPLDRALIVKLVRDCRVRHHWQRYHKHQAG